MKTPDFTPPAIAGIVLGAIFNGYVIFGTDLTDQRKAGLTAIVSSVVLAAFFVHDALVRHGRANVAAAKVMAEPVPLAPKKRPAK